jgi:hypothetical protein
MVHSVGFRFTFLVCLLANAAGFSQLSTDHGGIRKLLQPVQGPADDTGDIRITFVGTSAELAAAVARGAHHIEVTAHLDLTSLSSSGNTILGILPTTVKSIRVCPCLVPSSV